MTLINTVNLANNTKTRFQNFVSSWLELFRLINLCFRLSQQIEYQFNHPESGLSNSDVLRNFNKQINRCHYPENLGQDQYHRTIYQMIKEEMLENIEDTVPPCL